MITSQPHSLIPTDLPLNLEKQPSSMEKFKKSLDFSPSREEIEEKAKYLNENETLVLKNQIIGSEIIVDENLNLMLEKKTIEIRTITKLKEEDTKAIVERRERL
jgi:hypothetical protein